MCLVQTTQYDLSKRRRGREKGAKNCVKKKSRLLAIEQLHEKCQDDGWGGN